MCVLAVYYGRAVVNLYYIFLSTGLWPKAACRKHIKNMFVVATFYTDTRILPSQLKVGAN